MHLPPLVDISQKTLKGFPLFSGSIQYSPLLTGIPLTIMSLQERPGVDGETKIDSCLFEITGNKHNKGRIPDFLHSYKVRGQSGLHLKKKNRCTTLKQRAFTRLPIPVSTF